MWSLGEQTTFQGAWDCLDKRVFVWFRRKAVVKEKTKTIKSICRENVNTACWVAAHVVKKNVSVIGGNCGLGPFCKLCEPAGHLGLRAAGGTVGRGRAEPLCPGVCGWWSSPCSWLLAVIASPIVSLSISPLPALQGSSEKNALFREALW